MIEFKPTRLMVKRHAITGLRYFCKTTTEKYDRYKGSGLHWERHIKKHGTKHVITEWVSDLFTDPDDIKDFALLFSELHDIVKSVQWANMKPENGLDGGWPQGDEVRRKQKETFNDPVWKETVGKERTRKSLEGFKKTTSDPVWQATVKVDGYKKSSESQKGVPKSLETRRKMSETQLANGGNGLKKHTPESLNKRQKTRNADDWWENIGSKGYAKRSATMADPKWKETKGAKSTEKMAKTRSTDEWIALHSVSCLLCQGTMLNSGFHLHYKKCKLKKDNK